MYILKELTVPVVGGLEVRRVSSCKVIRTPRIGQSVRVVKFY